MTTETAPREETRDERRARIMRRLARRARRINRENSEREAAEAHKAALLAAEQRSANEKLRAKTEAEEDKKIAKTEAERKLREDQLRAEAAEYVANLDYSASPYASSVIVVSEFLREMATPKYAAVAKALFPHIKQPQFIEIAEVVENEVIQ